MLDNNFLKNTTTIEDVLNNGINNYELKVSSKEELLKNKEFKYAINYVLNEKTIYIEDKKEMQKRIVKAYISFISKFREDVLDTIGVYFNFAGIEKIALFARYGKNNTPGEFIKKIKKFDEISFEDLILYEYRINHYIFTCICTMNEHDKKTELFKSQLVILRATIEVIKCIRYNYLNYDISCFDKNNKPKKVFVNKSLIDYREGFYTINKNYAVEKNAVDHLEERFFKKGLSLTRKNLVRSTLEYLKWLDYNKHVLADEYSKLILDEKYMEYVSNKVDNILDVKKEIIDLRLFFDRKILMPKSGVLILTKNDDVIESILLKEVYKFNINHFVFIAKYKDGKELVNTIALLKDDIISATYLSYENEVGYRAIDYIHHFLDGKDVSGIEDGPKYEVLSPTYWKYRNRGYKSENDKLNDRGLVVKREFEVEIAPFIRKINGEASKEAKSLSDKLGVNLKDGYTIVKPHIRKYNTQKQ